jgi:hypothetical protein
MRYSLEACSNDKTNVLKGVTAGIIGGLVASWVMEEFQSLWFKLSESLEGAQEESTSGETSERSQQTQDAQGNGSSVEQQRGEEALSAEAELEPAPVKAAEAISEGLFGHKLTKDEKKIAGPAVHYALGMAVGGLYGGLAEVEPEISAGVGLPFGTVFWLVVDETAVPLLGLSKGPTQYPVSTHVYALASHLVYGVTTDIVRRGVRSVL